MKSKDLGLQNETLSKGDTKARAGAWWSRTYSASIQKEKKKKEEAGREEWKREDDREEGKGKEEAEAEKIAGIL